MEIFLFKTSASKSNAYTTSVPKSANILQVTRLKNLALGHSAHKLKSNYRFIQKINNRTITRYDLTGESGALSVALTGLCFYLGLFWTLF